ncbi:unnamed protein product, partial [marine sediment metagenome]
MAVAAHLRVRPVAAPAAREPVPLVPVDQEGPERLVRPVPLAGVRPAVVVRASPYPVPGVVPVVAPVAASSG